MSNYRSKPPLALLRACFGLCLDSKPNYRPDYAALKKDDDKTPAANNGKATPKQKERRRPQTDWREIPLVSRYTLIKQIGKGGFSSIWLAENLVTRDQVALKVVFLKDEDLEPEEVGTLIAEASFLRTLDCPHLIKCYDTAHTDEWLVLALEYLSGGEMLDHIHKVKKYTEAEAAKLFAQVVSAISYLHNLNLMHRDIKPENVMFTSRVEQSEAEGKPLRVKVIDLGMATVYDPKKEIRGCIGTPGFVAPELWNDGPHTPAGDVYSLGVVLFIMLTGRKPHSGADIRMMTYCNKSIRDAPGLKDERFLDLSAAARELLLAMLADDPLARPSCLAVLKHPFITAVDGNADAHREMGDIVRRRMRDLAQLRRVHGLRYALRVQKPQGADHQAFLEVLDQQRLRLKREMAGFNKPSDHVLGRGHGLGRASENGFGHPSDSSGCSNFTRPSEGLGGGGGPFARCSLGTSYLMPPAALVAGPPAYAPLPTTCTTATSASYQAPLIIPTNRLTGAVVHHRSGGSAPVSAGSSAPPSALASAAATPMAQPGSATAASSDVTAASPLEPPKPQELGLSRIARPPAAPPPAQAAGQAAAAAVPLPGQTLSSSRQPSSPSLPALQAEAAAAEAAAPAPKLRSSKTGPNASSPDLRSQDLGTSARDSLVARPVTAFLAAAATDGGTSSPWAIPGALGRVAGSGVAHGGVPPLQHCASMAAAEWEEQALPGGSPVAPPSVLEQAVLTKCMSANPLTLELLGAQASLERLLGQAAPDLGDTSLLLLAAAAAEAEALRPPLPPLPAAVPLAAAEPLPAPPAEVQGSEQ